MIFGSKKLLDVSPADLQALKEREVPESKTIDYKLLLPGTSDGDKKEFLFDVAAFANASGGHLLFGVKEEGGIPTDIPGVVIADRDGEIRRIESLVLDSIDPRIPGLEMRFIQLENSNHVLVLRIPKSWMMPHMVTLKGANKFYSRNSAGKYPIEVSELRSLFLLAGGVVEQIKKFRTARLSQIIADEGPVRVGPNAKTILHIVPIQSVATDFKIDLEMARQQFLNPLGAPHIGASRVNLDGILNCGHGSENRYSSYLQFFHNGIIETVDAYTLTAGSIDKLIPSTLFESKLIQHIDKYMAALKLLGVSAPAVVMVSLLGVEGFCMATANPHYGSHPIDRDTVLIPEILLPNLDPKPVELKPILDAVWNAAGKMSSPNFNAKGQWSPL